MQASMYGNQQNAVHFVYPSNNNRWNRFKDKYILLAGATGGIGRNRPGFYPVRVPGYLLPGRKEELLREIRRGMPVIGRSPAGCRPDRYQRGKGIETGVRKSLPNSGYSDQPFGHRHHPVN